MFFTDTLNSFISSGQNNTIAPNASYGVIVGGRSNSIQNLAPPDTSAFNFISNGENNTIEHGTRHSSILGGSHNVIATGAFNSVILGGNNITALQPNTVYAPNMAVTGLAGSGERQLMVDSAGNLKAMPVFPPPPCDPVWKTDGNDVLPTCDPFIGTKNAADLVFKTNSNDVINGGERMRITATGNIGIGTNNPQHQLHLHSEVPNGGDPEFLRHLDTTLHFDSTGNYFSEPIQTNIESRTLQMTNTTTEQGANDGLLFGLSGIAGFLDLIEPNAPMRVSATGGLSLLSASGNIFMGISGSGTGGVQFRTGSSFIFRTRTPGIKMIINSAGKVGIGTTVPSEKLQVNGGNVLIKGTNNFQTNGDEAVLYLGDNNHYIKSVFGGGLRIGTFQAPDDIMVLQSSGSVGISAPRIPTDPYSGQLFKLAVGGKIIAEEYVVRAIPDWPWPDYKFTEKLMPWKDFQNEVVKLGHFPGLPSAKEVDKKKVFSLGKVQIGHLAITETLYCYLGEAKNEVAELKKENAELKARIEKIEKSLGQK